MGCFGYICNGCETPIVGNCFTGGELAILQHIRHGKVLGMTVGYYNEYGTVLGEDKHTGFRATERDDLLNSHSEICDSEFSMHDSSHEYEGEERLYKDREVNYRRYASMRLHEVMIEARLDGTSVPEAIEKYEADEDSGALRAEFQTRPLIPLKPARSGIEAWHWKCYCHATEEQKFAHTISKSDPDQSWGRVRRKYRGEVPSHADIMSVVNSYGNKRIQALTKQYPYAVHGPFPQYCTKEELVEEAEMLGMTLERCWLFTNSGMHYHRSGGEVLAMCLAVDMDE